MPLRRRALRQRAMIARATPCHHYAAADMLRDASAELMRALLIYIDITRCATPCRDYFRLMLPWRRHALATLSEAYARRLITLPLLILIPLSLLIEDIHTCQQHTVQQNSSAFFILPPLISRCLITPLLTPPPFHDYAVIANVVRTTSRFDIVITLRYAACRC